VGPLATRRRSRAPGGWADRAALRSLRRSPPPGPKRSGCPPAV